MSGGNMSDIHYRPWTAITRFNHMTDRLPIMHQSTNKEWKKCAIISSLIIESWKKSTIYEQQYNGKVCVIVLLSTLFWHHRGPEIFVETNSLIKSANPIANFFPEMVRQLPTSDKFDKFSWRSADKILDTHTPKATSLMVGFDISGFSFLKCR